MDCAARNITLCQAAELARDRSRWRSTVDQSGCWSTGTIRRCRQSSKSIKPFLADTDARLGVCGRSLTLELRSALWSLWSSSVAALTSSFLAAMCSAGRRTLLRRSFSSRTATTRSWPCCRATASGVNPSYRPTNSHDLSSPRLIIDLSWCYKTVYGIVNQPLDNFFIRSQCTYTRDTNINCINVTHFLKNVGHF